MKKVIEIILGLIGALCFCCICSEPCEGTSMSNWVIWELSWMAALVLDIKVITYCAKKGIIDVDPDEDGRV